MIFLRNKIIAHAIVVTILVIVITTILTAQKTGNFPVNDLQIIVEAHYFGEGMSGITGEHLIARIYKNGKLEFEDINKQNVYQIKKSLLSKASLKKLTQLLSNKSFENMDENFSAVYSTIDHSEDLQLKLSIDGKVKIIKVENFKPNLPKTKVIYPKQLVELVYFNTFAKK